MLAPDGEFARVFRLAYEAGVAFNLAALEMLRGAAAAGNDEQPAENLRPDWYTPWPERLEAYRNAA